MNSVSLQLHVAPPGRWRGLTKRKGVHRLTFTDGRGLNPWSFVNYDGYWYALPARYGRRKAGYPRREIGSEVRPGSTLLAYLGYRLHKNTLTGGNPFYLVQCSHGSRFGRSTFHIRPSHGWTGHTKDCFSKEELCQWCGTSDKRLFGATKSECMSCNRTRHRLGIYPCGKPKRKQAPKRLSPHQHECRECDPWPK